MKHTQEPWETGHFGELQEDDDWEFGRIYGPGENVIICDVYDENDMSIIAAAPEMLKACEFLAAWDQSNDDVELISIACSLARQSINKVKGYKT